MKTIKKIDVKSIALPARKRVAAYARVSMESDRLAHSLSTQISYYNDLIQNNPEWEFAGVYADNFISGTSVERRAEFKRMIQDCEDGKIDIILTKSISRFARNTVDLLNTVRRLKELGIEVQFEKENLYTAGMPINRGFTALLLRYILQLITLMFLFIGVTTCICHPDECDGLFAVLAMTASLQAAFLFTAQNESRRILKVLRGGRNSGTFNKRLRFREFGSGSSIRNTDISFAEYILFALVGLLTFAVNIIVFSGGIVLESMLNHP